MSFSRVYTATTAIAGALLLLLCLFHSPGLCAADSSSLIEEQQSNTLKFLQMLAGESSGLQSTWTGTSYCAWTGIECDGAAVTVNFDDVTLTSPMTLPELGADVDAAMVGVTSVKIFNKESMVTGTLPSSWGDLTQLQFVDLHGNALTGTLPAAWSGMTALTEVYMDSNQLSGPLPEQWSRMAALNTLMVASNTLTGTLPPAWGSMTQLQLLDLSSNTLSGTLPAAWSLMSVLETITLSSNDLSGSLPASWGTMPALMFVFVDGNAFCGCLPTEWTSNTQLYVMVAAAVEADNCTTANVCDVATTEPTSMPTPPPSATPASRSSAGRNLTPLWCVLGVVGGLVVIAGVVIGFVLHCRRQRALAAAEAEKVVEEQSKEPFSTTGDSTV